MPITRFAPSPTGLLHLGHAFSAMFARDMAGPGGTMLLRIEDIDQTRARPIFIDAIKADLAWLGLDWPEPVRCQSQHFAEYEEALCKLMALDLIYPCFCTRRELAARHGDGDGGMLLAPHDLPPPYPGTCRDLSGEQQAERLASDVPFAYRLNVRRALDRTGPLVWRDLDDGWITADPLLLGDPVLARKDTPASYHLAVAWDDAVQGVELVTRARDLFAATHLHRLLQALLGLPVPVWRHHKILSDGTGKRLAKRDNAPSLQHMREAGMTPDQVRQLLAEGTSSLDCSRDKQVTSIGAGGSAGDRRP